MAIPRYSSQWRYYAGGPDWAVEFSTAADAATHTDGMNIIRRRRQSQTGQEAIPTLHANVLSVASMDYDPDISEQIITRGEGVMFQVDETNRRFRGGPFRRLIDTRTVALEGLITRPMVFRQGAGPWLRGLSTAALDSVHRVLLTNSSPAITGINFNPGVDEMWLIVTDPASCSLTVSSGGDASGAIAVAANSNLIDQFGKGALGNAAVTNGRLAATGLTGSETLGGWLLIGPCWCPQGRN